jgi:hypothetical protein
MGATLKTAVSENIAVISTFYVQASQRLANDLMKKIDDKIIIDGLAVSPISLIFLPIFKALFLLYYDISKILY